MVNREMMSGQLPANRGTVMEYEVRWVYDNEAKTITAFGTYDQMNAEPFPVLTLEAGTIAGPIPSSHADEYVVENPSLVHIEQMDDDLWHMNIHTDMGVISATMRGLRVDESDLPRPD
jgi:hypothetical protein